MTQEGSTDPRRGTDSLGRGQREKFQNLRLNVSGN